MYRGDYNETVMSKKVQIVLNSYRTYFYAPNLPCNRARNAQVRAPTYIPLAVIGAELAS